MTKIFGNDTSGMVSVDEIQEVMNVFTITSEDEKVVKRLFIQNGKLTVEYEDGV